MNILPTGGTGYIGSHAAVTLLQAGHEVILLDNLSNSDKSVVERIERITGKSVTFVQGDVRDVTLTTQALQQYAVEAVIHFAGLKAVGESVANPVLYYANNVQGTINLLQAMEQASVHALVFSSSATVYGTPQYLPYDETHPTAAINPYGRTKLQVEDMLRDVAASNPAWRMATLRYFNPVGAHESGLLGESPAATPSNLMPVICDVALGRRAELPVFGTDYPTRDGSCIRDFIHVMDLAQGHVRALHWMAEQPAPQCVAVNLGTGRGHSVLEMVQAFQAANGVAVPYRVVARRPGEVADCHADARLAQSLLGWQAERGLAAMCTDAWRWSQSHPGGFARAGSKAAAV